MIMERAERLCRISHERLRSKMRGPEFSVAHEGNAGCAFFGSPIGRSIMSAKDQRKAWYGGIDGDLPLLSHSATLFQGRWKRQ